MYRAVRTRRAIKVVARSGGAMSRAARIVTMWLNDHKVHVSLHGGQVAHPHRASSVRRGDRAAARTADQVVRGLHGELELAVMLVDGDQPELLEPEDHRPRSRAPVASVPTWGLPPKCPSTTKSETPGPWSGRG